MKRFITLMFTLLVISVLAITVLAAKPSSMEASEQGMFTAVDACCGELSLYDNGIWEEYTGKCWSGNFEHHQDHRHTHQYECRPGRNPHRGTHGSCIRSGGDCHTPRQSGMEAIPAAEGSH